ncbi:MAG: hypothetical protein KC418_18535 [Anaerolineales bacterium]|nr:hypothetical protein [Anaerolineales bacterium]MCB8953537.1 hypothetical protein [Ardenticatenales bacterium]
MTLSDQQVTIEEKPEWQKVVMPAERNWLLFLIYTILMLVWTGMFGIILAGLLSNPFNFEVRALFIWVWRILLLLWLAVWVWFARRWLWRYWQYYAASREILFINAQEFIVRRPVSLLGVTDVYDMKHVTPLRYDAEEKAIAFEYGVRPVRFGRALAPTAAQDLVERLNRRHFAVDDEEPFMTA